MIFYHYTSLFHLPMIQAGGLSRGEVPLSPTNIENAVWLTTSHTPQSQLWKEGSAVDKGEIRITVDMKECEVIKWEDYARANNVDPMWYKVLNVTGGNEAHCWYLYFGTLHPNRFLKIERFRRTQ